MRRGSLVALLAVAAVGPGHAQNALITQEQYVLREFDADSTSVAYFVAKLQKGPARIKTVGSSTTVTSLVTGQKAFLGVLAPGAASQDNLSIQFPAVPVATEAFRIVATKTSDDEITVNTAIDLTAGYDFNYLQQRGGTTAADGWFPVGGFRSFSATINYAQGDLDALDIKLQCRHGLPGGGIVDVYPTEGNDGCGGSGTATGGYCRLTPAPVVLTISVLNDEMPFEGCRFGFKVATTDTSDAGANVEQLTITLRGAQ